MHNKWSYSLVTAILICTLGLGLVNTAFAKTPVCQGNRQVVPFNGQNIPLEPSGLVYDKQHDIFIAVSDNFEVLKKSHAENFVIFWFKDTGEDTLLAYPLLTNEQADKFNLYDLEGITVDNNQHYYAIGSLALHPTKPSRDTWFRFQGFQFNIKKSSDGLFGATDLDWLSANNQRDLREWFISLVNMPWTLENIRGRAETEDGINVEGLSVTPENNLLVGFRGPLFYNKNKKAWQSMAVEVKPPQSPNDAPEYVQSYWLANEQGDKKTQKYGFRGLTPVPDKPWWYAVVTGPTGTDYKQFQIMLWNAKTGEVRARQLQPEPPGKFVWEGIAIKNILREKSVSYLQVALIDDLNACFKYAKIAVKN